MTICGKYGIAAKPLFLVAGLRLMVGLPCIVQHSARTGYVLLFTRPDCLPERAVLVRIAVNCVGTVMYLKLQFGDKPLLFCEQDSRYLDGSMTAGGRLCDYI